MQFINQMEPWFDESETRAVMEYMNSGGWLTEHTHTRIFENMLAEYTGSRYCSAVCNGTAALIVALLACGVGRGDEVIVPDYTMAATPNAAELVGAKAVFVDIERDSLCMDFDKMQAAITDQTKAIMLVSINGRYPSAFERFIAFCRTNDIWLIEDAAQSMGSRYQGKHLGTFGDVGCFSFSAPKIITTGQGGALVTDNDDLYYKIRMIKDFGREENGRDHHLIKGWNFKFTDLQAVIGIEQMKKLDWRVERKKQMGRVYDSILRGIPGVETVSTNYEETALWFFDALAEKRSELIDYLKQNNIGTREFYPPLHSQPAYGYQLSFPVTQEIAGKGIWLPSASFLSDQEIEHICKKIMSFYIHYKPS